MSRSLLFLLIVTGMVWSCTKQSIQPPDTEDIPPAQQNITFNNLTTGSFTEVYTSVVSPAGASVKIAKPNTPVDGLQLIIPANSFSSTQTLKIAYAEIKSHQLGTDFHPISPLISISLDGGYSSEMMSISIPVKIPAGHIPIGFYFDDTTGKLEGIPFKSIDSNSITLLTRHFLPASKLKSGGINLKNTYQTGANMVICSISENKLYGQPIISSGFKPGIDDWEFINDGSYIAPGGHCAGQNIAAMWYYYEKKTTEGKLFNRFSDNPTLWQDNSKGYRFCSVLHQDLDWDGFIVTKFANYIDMNQSYDWEKLLTIAGTMLLTHEPQGIGVYRQIGIKDGKPIYEGHDLICYQVSVSSGKLFISDPNTPGVSQSIDFSNSRFQPPYRSSQNGHSSSVEYPFVTYYAKTALIDWDKIGKRYAELLDNTIGNILPNSFPFYKLWIKDNAGIEVKDGHTVTKETLFIKAICDAEVWHPFQGQKLIGLKIYKQDGTIAYEESADETIVTLNPGKNIMGFYIYGWRLGFINKFGNYDQKFVDFKWMTVNYVFLKLTPDQLLGVVDKELKFTAISKGSAPKPAKYLWNFGDGTAAFTKTNDSTAVHTFSKGGTYSIKVELLDNVTNAKITEATLSYNVIEEVIPKVTTSSASSITTNTATCGGNVTNDGGAAVTARGVCWSVNANPTTANSKTSNGTGTGSFTSSLTGLAPNTTYYARAYATNSRGTAYGSQISFTTTGNLPTITTSAASSITTTNATSGGNVTNDGGNAVTARGVCWSVNANPTTANSKTSNGTGTGSFTSSLTGLSPNTTYYARAYATNSAGTSYGNEITFKTSANPPTVTTTAASAVTSTTASSGGNVTNEGSAPVTARGVCWSVNANPTTANSKTSNGTGTGSFTSSLTQLSPNTTYYARAYATNSIGTAYGSQISFTTSGINLSLDGRWYSGGTGIIISGSTGTFYSFSPNWQAAANQGLVSIGAAKLKNITKVSTYKWNCLDLWWHAPSSGAAPDYVMWSTDGSITMSNDGQSITTSSNAYFDGKTSNSMSTWYRQP